MSINDTIKALVLNTDCVEGSEGNLKTLIFVLSNKAREYIEYHLKCSPGGTSSIQAVITSRSNINILFLNKLQYLFMYLMKLEAEEDPTEVVYNSLVIYGLDILLKESNTIEPTHNNLFTRIQLRYANLIYSAIFKIERKHNMKLIKIVPYDAESPLSKRLAKIELYWRSIC